MGFTVFVKIKRLIQDSSFIRFAMVGVINTLVGTGTMFLQFNCIPWGDPDAAYWISSGCNYIIGGFCSYFLNKYFTFRSKQKNCREILAFIVEQAVCWVLAYGLAQPLVRWILSGTGVNLQGNVSMLTGMGLFVLLNYFGQKFFVFKSKNES